MKNYNKYIFSVLFVILITSCTGIFEEPDCDHNGYVNFTCLDEYGQEDIHLSLLTVSDFIFTPDSVLYRVDADIRGERICSREMNLQMVMDYCRYGNLVVALFCPHTGR